MPMDVSRTATDLALNVYRMWVTGNSGYSTTSVTTSGTDRAWLAWNGCKSTVNSYTSLTAGTCAHRTDTVWMQWQTMEQPTRIEHVRTAPPPPTPEMIRAAAEIRATAEKLARAAEAERMAKQAAAKKRARGLLMSHLTREQRDSYERHGYFDVVVSGQTYRIKQGTHGNVARVDDAGVIARYCAQPDGVPDEDAMLAQLLSLRFAPASFFDKANVTRVRN